MERYQNEIEKGGIKKELLNAQTPIRAPAVYPKIGKIKISKKLISNRITANMCEGFSNLKSIKKTETINLS